MAGLIPWRRKQVGAGGNGGALAPLRDFPTLMRRREPYADPERVAKVVLRVLSRHVSSGEIESVKGNLPAEIRSLWA